MKNILKMDRNELIEELRKYIPPAKFHEAILAPTAMLRGLLAYNLSAKADKEDDRHYIYAPRRAMKKSVAHFLSHSPVMIGVDVGRPGGDFSIVWRVDETTGS